MKGSKFIHTLFITLETALLIAAISLSTAIFVESKTESETISEFGPVQSQFRLIEGNYTTCGLIFTDDGHIWEYTDPTESVPQDYRVVVCFNTNGTESVQDDVVTKMVPLKIQDGTMYYEHFKEHF